MNWRDGRGAAEFDEVGRDHPARAPTDGYTSSVRAIISAVRPLEVQRSPCIRVVNHGGMWLDYFGQANAVSNSGLPVMSSLTL